MVFEYGVLLQQFSNLNNTMLWVLHLRVTQSISSLWQESWMLPHTPGNSFASFTHKVFFLYSVLCHHYFFKESEMKVKWSIMYKNSDSFFPFLCFSSFSENRFFSYSIFWSYSFFFPKLLPYIASLHCLPNFMFSLCNQTETGSPVCIVCLLLGVGPVL